MLTFAHSDDAYSTVDPKAANQDFVSISVPNKIIAAALTTRPDSARGNSFWLVLSTESSVVLYNLNRTVSGDDDTLQIQESATCDLDESGVKMLSLVTTYDMFFLFFVFFFQPRG